ncbi:phage tail tube protein [Promicromonospora sukumoe]
MSTPTQALASTLARDWILEVLIGSDWTRVRGLSSVSPIFEGSEQDDSDIDSGGFASQIVTGLAFRIEGSGKRKGENTSGFVDDPGQNYLRKKGRKTGADNIVTARIYRRDDLPDAHQAETTVKWTDSAAGDTNALQEFSFTLSGRGEPQEIAKPVAEKAVTFAGGPFTAGTFTLTVAGQTTAGIAFGATAAQIKTALELLSTVGAGNATVTGTIAAGLTITVPGTLSGNGSGLTPVGTITVA